jgi:uncharacterized delta-60 repeat protein
MTFRQAALLLTGALALGSIAMTAGATGLDPGYASGAGFTLTPLSPSTVDRFYGVTNAPDGGTYAVGITSEPGSSADQEFALAHIDAGGHLDRSFGKDGVAAINVRPGGTNAEIARGVVVQSVGANKGKIVISGQAESAADPADIDIYVVRFNANGTPDTTFGDAPGSPVRVLNLSPGIATTPVGVVRSPDNTWGLMKQADDKIVLEAVRGNGAEGAPNAGRADRDFAAVRLNPDGSRDKSFGVDGVAQIGAVFDEGGQTIRAVENPRQGLIQPDGKIVLAGYTQIGGLERPLLARFNPDGTPDASFGGNAGTGIATAFPNGRDGTAEVYEIGLQGTSFVTTGYGTPNAARAARREGVHGRSDRDADHRRHQLHERSRRLAPEGRHPRHLLRERRSAPGRPGAGVPTGSTGRRCFRPARSQSPGTRAT